jgi:hypothetical protein
MSTIPPPTPHTVDAIYAWHESRRLNFESDGIPFSQMGDPCDRKLWYAFRWTHYPDNKPGRMLRLFETGHREEARMIAELQAIGCEITDEQQKVSLARGHLRGKIEGVISGVVEAPKTQHLLECKTHKAESFRAIVKHGLREKKLEHWIQVLLGMHAKGLTRSFYIAHNKDTDELHTVRHEYDPVEAMQIEARANRIVDVHTPPPKLHENPESKAAFHCTYCPAKALCHEGAMPRRNCRTCLHSTPIENGWRCELHDQERSRAQQKAGCPDHTFLPGLVNGEQIDADPVARTVTYLMADGSEWVDGGGR